MNSSHMSLRRAINSFAFLSVPTTWSTNQNDFFQIQICTSKEIKYILNSTYIKTSWMWTPLTQIILFDGTFLLTKSLHFIFLMGYTSPTFYCSIRQHFMKSKLIIININLYLLTNRSFAFFTVHNYSGK